MTAHADDMIDASRHYNRRNDRVTVSAMIIASVTELWFWRYGGWDYFYVVDYVDGSSSTETSRPDFIGPVRTGRVRHATTHWDH